MIDLEKLMKLHDAATPRPWKVATWLRRFTEVN